MGCWRGRFTEDGKRLKRTRRSCAVIWASSTVRKRGGYGIV